MSHLWSAKYLCKNNICSVVWEGGPSGNVLSWNISAVTSVDVLNYFKVEVFIFFSSWNLWGKRNYIPDDVKMEIKR